MPGEIRYFNISQQGAHSILLMSGGHLNLFVPYVSYISETESIVALSTTVTTLLSEFSF